MNLRKYRNKFLALVGILLLFLLAYIRQSLFLVINAIINGEAHNYSNYTPPGWLVNNFTPIQLISLKWPLTLSFIFLTMGLTLLFLHLIFKDKNLNKIIVIIYVLLTIISFVFYSLGRLTDSFSVWYFWSHQLAMLCQSPLIFMFFLPVFWYLKKSN